MVIEPLLELITIYLVKLSYFRVFRSNFAISNWNMVTSRKSRKFADVVRLGWKQALWQALLFLLIGGIAWLKSSQRQNCPAAGCWAEPLHQSLPARPGSRRKLPASQGNRGYLGGNQAQEFLATSFLAFSALKMPKTTSLEIPGLDSPLGSLDSPLACRQRLPGLAGKDW